MSQKTDIELNAQADVIANETVTNANTKGRIATMYKDTIDSKPNNTVLATLQGELDTHEGRTDNPHDVTKSQIGLGSVDNTADIDKPVSTATQAAIEALTQVSITGAIALDSTAFGKMHICTGTSADYTVDLPTAVGNTGKSIAFKGSSALTKVVTLDGNSTQTIDGKTTRKMSTNGLIVVTSDGTNWHVVNEIGSDIPYTPTFVGYATNPAGLQIWYNLQGNRMTVGVFYTTHTATGTELRISIPTGYNFKYTTQLVGRSSNNGGAFVPGLVEMLVTDNDFRCYPTIAATTTWTASSTKACWFTATFIVV